MATRTDAIVDGPAELPDGLLDAFWDYDDALLTNDVARLDDAFAAGPGTIRGDSVDVVVGWEAIGRFRAARTVIPTRRVTVVHVRVHTPELATIVAEVASASGARGMQTQVWGRERDRWRVLAAHVSAPERTIDRATWRVVGTPLVAPTASGPLDGMTVAVKDLFAVAGHSIGAGVPEFAVESAPSTAHAPAVDRFLHAGAAVTGIAATDQFAYSIAGTNSRTGTPLNGADPSAVPGGSSSGPASATARGLVTVGLGTDTAGSIRVPSAYQGLWGIRTTHGLVSTVGVLPLAERFDTVGWMTRDADALVAVTDALVPHVASNEPSGELVAVPALTALAAAGTASAVSTVATALGAVEDVLDVDPEEWFAAFRTVQGYQAWRNHGAWIEAHPGVLGPDVAARFADASRISAADAVTATDVVETARAALRRWLDDRILVLPTVADRAPRLDADAATIDAHRAATLRLTSLASVAGLPAVAAPIGGPTAGAAPHSVCFVGAAGSDRALVRTVARLAASLTDRPDQE